MNLEITPAQRTDFKRCVELLDSPEFYAANGDKWKESWLEEYLDKNYFLVAKENNKVIGLVLGEKIKQKGSVLWLLVVDPVYRGKGIGSKLLTEYERSVKEEGVEWIILYSVLENNETLEFYKKNNYSAGKGHIECLKVL
jgi:ribosomal protein S18 acetylase RimI-like enzyme